MITKTSDFVGKYFIPNISEIGPNQENTGNQHELNRYIDDNEPEALVTLLGYPEYAKIASEIDVNGLKDNADEKWKRLVNGYEDYKGLKEALVAYIFYKYYEDDASQYTQTGEKILNGKNTEIVSYRPRAIKAWRRYYELTIGNFAITHSVLFGSQNVPVQVFNSKYGVGIIYGKRSNYKSLYDYTAINLIDFPDWAPKYFLNINVFDL